MQPTGAGLTVNGATDPCGDPGVPLPLRPQRADANDAKAIPGIVALADDAGDGRTDMQRTEPWRN